MHTCHADRSITRIDKAEFALSHAVGFGYGTEIVVGIEPLHAGSGHCHAGSGKHHAKYSGFIFHFIVFCKGAIHRVSAINYILELMAG